MTTSMQSQAVIKYNTYSIMNQEEAREYAREYRKDGFGRVTDRRYYMKHRERILEKQRERDRARAIYRKKLQEICESEENKVSLQPI